MMISHSLNTYVDYCTVNAVSEPFSFYVIYSFLVSREFAAGDSQGLAFTHSLPN